MKALACSLLFGLLMGCSGNEYWVKVYPPAEVESIEQVDDVTPFCGPVLKGQVLGCTVGIGKPKVKVYIKRGLSPEEYACVLAHEAGPAPSHATGWIHSPYPTMRPNCGGGYVVAEVKQ